MTAETPMLIGILGGSFNPPHVGHLALARTVLDLKLADRVCLIPAAVPPHKAVPKQAGPATRLAMARLLAQEDPRLRVDPLELEWTGTSYTIDTVRLLMADHPDRRYRIIIGSDLAKTFATWREYRELLRLAPPLVAERPDALFTGSDADYAGMTLEEAEVMRSGRFAMPLADVSSTKIRKLLAEGTNDAILLQYLTAPVLAFIRENGLYGTDVDSV